jgi:hypothetical protein
LEEVAGHIPRGGRPASLVVKQVLDELFCLKAGKLQAASFIKKKLQDIFKPDTLRIIFTNANEHRTTMIISIPTSFIKKSCKTSSNLIPYALFPQTPTSIEQP